jgi:hypothetical protein
VPEVPKGRVLLPPRSIERPQYLTVDVDIKSTRSLSILIAALKAKRSVYVDDLGNFRGRNWIHVGIYAGGTEPAIAIRRYLDLFRRLPAPARRLLKHCTVEFDIGIESSSEHAPRKSGEWILPPRLINAVARAGGHIRITVYPPDAE